MFGKNGQKGFFRSRVSILGRPPRGPGGNAPSPAEDLTTLERSLNRWITLEIKIDEKLVRKDAQ